MTTSERASDLSKALEHILSCWLGLVYCQHRGHAALHVGPLHLLPDKQRMSEWMQCAVTIPRRHSNACINPYEQQRFCLYACGGGKQFSLWFKWFSLWIILWSLSRMQSMCVLVLGAEGTNDNVFFLNPQQLNAISMHETFCYIQSIMNNRTR